MNFIIPALIILAVMICCLVIYRLGASGSTTDFKEYFPDEPDTVSVPHGALKIVYLGTCSLLFDDGKTQLLIDGFFSRPSFLQVMFSGISADEKAVGAVIEKAGIDRLKALFVSHSHFDHSLDAPSIIRRTDAVLYGSSSTLNIGRGGGLPENRMKKFGSGEIYNIGDFKVTVIKSRHTPYITILGVTNAPDPLHDEIDAPLIQPARQSAFIEGGTYDFLIEHKNRSILIKGSTNFIEGELNKFSADIIFLGIGLLSKQNPEFREQYYRETVEAVRAKTVIPVHWDNFMKPLTEPLEPNITIGGDFKSAVRFIMEKTKAGGIEFLMLQSFQEIILY